MYKKYKFLAAFLVICFFIPACNLPSGVPTEIPASEASPTFTPIPVDLASATPTPAAAPITNCSPAITTNTDANVRGGPSQVYGILGVIPLGGTAPVAGKNFDGTWWYIQFAAGPGGYAWIAGSVVTATCIPNALAVIAPPPTPIVPTNVPTNTTAPGAPSSTPVPGYTFVFDPGLILIDPGDLDILFINTPTPTPFIFIPVWTPPCFWPSSC